MQTLIAFELSARRDHLLKTDPGVREGPLEKSNPKVRREPEDSRGPMTRKGLVWSDRWVLRRNQKSREGDEAEGGTGEQGQVAKEVVVGGG